MDYEKLLPIIFSFLAMAGAAYSFFQKRKDEKAKTDLTGYTDLQKVHLTESADLRREQRQMLSDANKTIETLQKATIEAREAANKLSYENEIFKDHNGRLKEQVAELTVEVKRLRVENDAMENELEEIREKQSERVTHEAETLIQNEQLKTEIKELKDGQRKSILFYENTLKENQKEKQKMKLSLAAHSAAIEKLKRILADNGITENVEV